MNRSGSLLALATLAAAGFAPAQAQQQELRGEVIVQMQCAKCHEQGTLGAPRIGDRDAWIPRLKEGVDPLVRRAMRGHDNMPARGGMAQLTDGEFRNAVVYMFNGGNGNVFNGNQAERPAAAAPEPSPYRKTVEGIEFDLGVVPAQRGVYHVNVGLHDAATRAELKNAIVDARVATPLNGQTKRLQPGRVNGMTGYGNDFSMPGTEAYTVTVWVRRKAGEQPIQTRFDYKP